MWYTYIRWSILPTYLHLGYPFSMWLSTGTGLLPSTCFDIRNSLGSQMLRHARTWFVQFFFQWGYHYGIIWNNMGGINAVDDKLDLIMPDTSRCDVTELILRISSAQSWWNLAWLCNYILQFVHVHYNFQTSHNWVLIIIQNLVNYAIVRFHGRLSTRRPAGRKYAFFCFKEVTGIMIMIIIHMDFLPQSAFQGTRRLWKHENSKADLSKLKNLRTQVPDIAIAIALFLLKHLLATFATTKLGQMIQLIFSAMQTHMFQHLVRLKQTFDSFLLAKQFFSERSYFSILFAFQGFTFFTSNSFDRTRLFVRTGAAR